MLDYFSDPSFQRRFLTVCFVGPLVLLAIYTRTGMTITCWALHFCAMLEWTGLKRHLKLCLLDPLIYPQRRRLQQMARRSPRRGSQDGGGGGGGGGSSGVVSPQEAAALTAAAASGGVVNPIALSGRNSGWAGGDEAEDDIIIMDDLSAWPDSEYPRPVAPLNAFITLKCFMCSLICPLAAWRMEMFPLILTAYFFFWVVLTLLDKNRVETKQGVAQQKIKLTKRTRSSSADGRVTSSNRHEIRSSSSSSKKREKESGSNKSSLTEASEKKPLQPTLEELPDADEFALRELEIISVFPNVETFLNFCLEYFGFVWVSHISVPCIILGLGDQGHAVVLITLVANWMNDIGALLVGKTLKSLKFNTTPLFLRVSPSKSLEGAIGGVIFNAAALALGPWILPAAAIGVPQPTFVFFVVGVVLGCVGVVGDLLQSLFKRVAKIKDTGNVFPGHGGVLDRIDGLLCTYPVVFWLIWGLQNGYFDAILSKEQ